MSRRVVAGLIDGTVLALVGLPASSILRRSRFAGRHQVSRVTLTALDAAYRIGLPVLAGHTLGQLTLRIRVVHQDSAAMPTWRQATLRWAVAAAAMLAPSLLPTPSSTKDWMHRFEQLRPRIDELRRTHGHDRQRLSEELMALYRQAGVNPAGGTLAVLPQVMASLVGAGVVYLPVLRRPLRQGLHDRVARTIVVQTTRAMAPPRR